MTPFSYLYPFSRDALMDISYYFAFEYADDRAADEYAGDVIALTAAWRAADNRGDLQLTVPDEDTIQILDTRGELQRRPRRAVLDGWKAAVYLACDRAAGLPKLLALHADEAELRAFLGRCVEHRLMLTDGTRWLGLAVAASRSRSFALSAITWPARG